MIYFDNAATTPLDEIAIDALKEYGVEKFFNPSALYREALENTKTLNAARENILKIMHGDGDFIFTASIQSVRVADKPNASGTEADNMAIYGVKKPKNARIIVSASEHSAMLNPATDLLNKGYDVVFAPLNPDGSVNIDEFKKLLNKDVCFVSIMHVNNETGAVNDLQKIVKLTKSVAPKSIVHSDGVQALMKVKVNLLNLGVDMYSVSAHKVHAPRGVGGLYIRKGVRINPLILGGGQEKGLRSATENLAGIVAFSKILEKYDKMFNENVEKRKVVLDYLRKKISDSMPEHIIVSPENSPHILMLALKGVRGEVMLHSLEDYGILIGVGSACSSKKGINKFQSLLSLDDEHKEGIIRVSVSETNTIEECDFFLEKLKYLTDKLTDYKRI